MGRGLSEVSYDTLPDIPLDAEGTLGDHLYSVLEESILDGLLPAGSHILPGELSRRYGVSIVPIRESLRALDANGWVKIRAHQGAFVRTGNLKEVSDIFDSRLVIETSLAVRAAEKRTPVDMGDLHDLVSRGHEIAQQEAGAAFARLNSQFHRRVAEAADNSILLGYQIDMNKCVRFYFSRVSQHRMLASAREHDAIVQAIEAGDRQATSELSIQHIHNTRVLVKDSAEHEWPSAE
jgi:DNA-binding GntR family transcriptional regulator